MPQSLLFFFLSLAFVLLDADQAVPNDELSILLSIKSSLVDPMHRLKEWRVPSNGVGNRSPVHCGWTGVFCSDGVVERLDLSNMKLNGSVSDRVRGLTGLAHLNISCNEFVTPLPKSLSGLVSLRSIDVSQNYFVGEFPRGLGESSVLTYVNASSNNFSGFLPEDLGNATSLESLDFRGSFFEGTIPVSFKSLKKLRFLGLSGNNLTGNIPGTIGELSALETLILGYNEFEGEIPAEIGNLANLRYLDLAVGSLDGRIPPELGKLQRLTTVYLYKNRFTGAIPPEIGNLTSLMFLDLSDNRISGNIPAEIASLKNLQLLNLMRNNLTGFVPEKIGELPKLEVLELWMNSLRGPLPMSLGKNSPLKWLDVSSNSLSGEIPPGLCDTGNLTKLILFNNSFSGPIPLGLSNCSSLVRVRIQHNLISGTIPIGFGSLPILQRLELAKNNLTGHIPADLAMSSSLSFIDISSNNIDSSIPSTLLALPNLQTFSASNNNMRGNIPNQFQDCPFLSVLDLSSNLFSGPIPESIASCEKLVNLNLRNNSFNGELPESLSTMPTLAVLDLSNNSFVGRIPNNFGNSPALEMLNLSYNHLEGPVPHNGILITINPDDLTGNPGLCDGVLPPCPRSYSLRAGTEPNKRANRIALGFILGVAAIFTLGLAFFAGRYAYTKWHLCNTLFAEMFEKGDGSWPWRLVAFQRVSFTSSDILASVTESNVVGMGGSGTVYKAEFHSSVVAVKRLWREGTDSGDLLGEVNLLGRLRHRNIVRLLGFVHNEREVMMISEFMPNGNLWTALHGKEEGVRVLVDWVSRYNVAVGVAQGLRYLHHDCRPAVIHRDIKSSNILLDANLEARIADFGVARTMNHKDETLSVVAGSYGYIAPEYGYTMKVDEKTDIYSYGVVLLELVTGKTPLDTAFGETVDIVEWVRRKIRSKRATAVEEALDPCIAGQCRHIQEEMLLVLRIALLCTAKLPKDRPSMRDVITMLGEAKPRRKSVCQNSKEKPIFTASPAMHSPSVIF